MDVTASAVVHNLVFCFDGENGENPFKLVTNRSISSFEQDISVNSLLVETTP